MHSEKQAYRRNKVDGIYNSISSSSDQRALNLQNMATDAENHESVGFNFGHQTESTYKLTGIHKNLDLFVMERNERHLTSLNWNWQKLSKDADTGDKDNNKTESLLAPVVSPVDNLATRASSKARSRSESRQRLQELNHNQDSQEHRRIAAQSRRQYVHDESVQVPPGVAHEELSMTNMDESNPRIDSPCIASSINDKIKAIRNQLSELNEEIDCKIPVSELGIDVDADEQPVVYIISQPELKVITAALPEECLEIDLDHDAGAYLRSLGGFSGLHGGRKSEGSTNKDSGARMEQNVHQKHVLPIGFSTAPERNELMISREGTNCSRRAEAEYMADVRTTEFSSTLRDRPRYDTFDVTDQATEIEQTREKRYHSTSPRSSKTNIESPRFEKGSKKEKSLYRKMSESPEIKRSLPLCHQSVDSIQDSTISVNNSVFRGSRKRITSSSRRNDKEIFTESERDSGCRTGDGGESTGTLWKSTFAGKRNEISAKKSRMDSAGSTSQDCNRFFNDDKNSECDIIEEITYQRKPSRDSPISIQKDRMSEKDDGTISEISDGFLNEKEENFDKEKFSSNECSEIWTVNRTTSKRSLLEGLGTSYCVLPNFIWKYIGQETDDEPMTRKKCVAFILGAILAVLLLAILLGLIIGIATNSGPEESSPIRFTVIPGIPDNSVAADEVNDIPPE